MKSKFRDCQLCLQFVFADIRYNKLVCFFNVYFTVWRFKFIKQNTIFPILCFQKEKLVFENMKYKIRESIKHKFRDSGLCLQFVFADHPLSAQGTTPRSHRCKVILGYIFLNISFENLVFQTLHWRKKVDSWDPKLKLMIFSGGSTLDTRHINICMCTNKSHQYRTPDCKLPDGKSAHVSSTVPFFWIFISSWQATNPLKSWKKIISWLLWHNM